MDGTSACGKVDVFMSRVSADHSEKSEAKEDWGGGRLGSTGWGQAGSHVSQSQLHPMGDAGQYQTMKGCWVDFIFYYKNNDN